MIPKFRAYDSSSYKRMYQPDEVMVGCNQQGCLMMNVEKFLRETS